MFNCCQLFNCAFLLKFAVSLLYTSSDIPQNTELLISIKFLMFAFSTKLTRTINCRKFTSVDDLLIHEEEGMETCREADRQGRGEVGHKTQMVKLKV